jgi:hypothetical protein
MTQNPNYPADPPAIAAALVLVNATPGKRTEPGRRVLLALFDAPGHTRTVEALEKELGQVVNNHFGWLCNRVAEELKVEATGFSVLTIRTHDPDGKLRLTLKPSVVNTIVTFRDHLAAGA